MFIPIVKIDQARRLVYGIATEEVEDSSGETCHYDTTKPLYEKWSETMEKDTGGKSLGNLRAMHGPVAAGKITQINFNDEAKQIEICAKVVDDAEWIKVQEGVYSGFSQGGSYVKRWKDPETGVQYYTADPIEVSLVDRPCLPTATFSMIKNDGSVELRKFNVPTIQKEKPSMPTNSEVAAKAVELANAAGDKDWASYIEMAQKSFETSMATQASPIDEKSAQGHSDALIADAQRIEEEALSEDPKKKKADAQAAIAVGADPASSNKVLSPANTEQGEQVWQSNRDGALFKKKADMIAHNEAFDAAKAVAEITGGTESLLTELAAQVGKRKGPVKDDTTPPAEKDPIETATDLYKAIISNVDRTAISERAKALKLTNVLPKNWAGSTKKTTFAEAMKLEKGLPTCARLACLIEQLHTVKHATWMEAKTENDDSTVPMMLHQNLDDLCSTLKMMVEEETSELLQGQDVDDLENAEWAAMFQNFVELPDNVYGLVKQFLPRNLSDNLIEARTVSKMEKTKNEAEQLAKAKAEVTLPEELTKTLRAEQAKNEALVKKVDSMQSILEELVKGVKEIAEQPAPVQLPGTYAVEKDPGSREQATLEAAITKKLEQDPNYLAHMAFKNAPKTRQG
jgi:hypothetical protein